MFSLNICPQIQYGGSNGETGRFNEAVALQGLLPSAGLTESHIYI